MDGDSVWEVASLTRLPAPEHKHMPGISSHVIMTYM